MKKGKLLRKKGMRFKMYLRFVGSGPKWWCCFNKIRFLCFLAFISDSDKQLLRPFFSLALKNVFVFQSNSSLRSTRTWTLKESSKNKNKKIKQKKNKGKEIYTTRSYY